MTNGIKATLSKLGRKALDRVCQRAFGHRLVEHSCHILVYIVEIILKHDGEWHRDLVYHTDSICRIGANLVRKRRVCHHGIEC